MGRPDIILAEPIGTSTNVLSSVVAPLRNMYPDEFEVAPLLVVFDGTRAIELLQKPEGFGLGSQSRIIPLNQVHDAEVILISKCDLMSQKQIDEVMARIEAEAPGIEVVPYSAHTMKNVDKVVELMVSSRTSQKLPRPDDPSIFSTEKASMGWYNLGGRIVASRLDLSAFTTDILRHVAEAFPGRMTGHVKIVVSSPRVAVKIGLVEGQVQVEGLKGGRYLEGEGKLVINARVTTSPEELKRVFGSSVESTCARYQVRLDEVSVSCFAPRPEMPDHLHRK